MSSPATPPRSGAAAFTTLLDETVLMHARVKGTASHALAIALYPDQIIDYVRGVLTPSARANVMASLAHSAWGMSRVVALVKSRRDPASLGARLLVGEGSVDPYAWGIQDTGDPETDLATLLDKVV
jgi:uncharacterized protein YciW